MNKLILVLLLCSCTYNVVDSQPKSESYGIYIPPQASPVVEEKVPESDSKCIIKTDWINNCIITTVSCPSEDGAYSIRYSKCFSPIQFLPLKNIPDPPPFKN